jgi:ectoine hydroxylase-related dioxygenase (phytanoyl-CoA dioxygenase family)
MTNSDRTYALTMAEQSAFRERGLTSVYSHPLLAGDAPVTRRALDGYRQLEPGLAFPGPTHVDMERKLDSGKMWFQSTFTVVPELFEVASHPAILDRVVSILGPDVLLWASSVLTKRPGESHYWHIDTAAWEVVTVFVGLRGMSRGSVVKALSHSHRLGMSPFDLFTTGEANDMRGTSPLSSDATVAAAARKLDPRCDLVQPEMKDGDFYMFDGLTWHGSLNTTEVPRTAVTFFFSRPDADIRIPTAFGSTPVWYREKPACTLVAGIDRFRKNRIVPPAARTA